MRKTNMWAYLLVVLLACGIGLISMFYSQSKDTIDTFEQRIAKQKQTEKILQKEVDRLRGQIETQNQEEPEKEEKQVEDMAQTSARLTEALFTQLYTYCSDESSVGERKEKVQALVTPAVLESLFPEDTENLSSTVSTVSRLEKAPTIYLDPTSKQEWKGIVFVDYAVSIADSEEQKGRFLYRVTIDPKTQRFTSIHHLGDVNGY